MTQQSPSLIKDSAAASAYVSHGHNRDDCILISSTYEQCIVAHELSKDSAWLA